MRGLTLSQRQTLGQPLNYPEFNYQEISEIYFDRIQTLLAAFEEYEGNPSCPAPYSEEKARQWAAEDPQFCKETYKQDPYFTKEEQAELRRRRAGYEAGEIGTVSWEELRKANVHATN
jgi:hypothetical protein